MTVILFDRTFLCGSNEVRFVVFTVEHHNNRSDYRLSNLLVVADSPRRYNQERIAACLAFAQAILDSRRKI